METVETLSYGKKDENKLPDLTKQADLIIHSSDIFGEKGLVLIRHNDGWYKLMVTKQNKLILTK